MPRLFLIPTIAAGRQTAGRPKTNSPSMWRSAAARSAISTRSAIPFCRKFCGGTHDHASRASAAPSRIPVLEIWPSWPGAGHSHLFCGPESLRLPGGQRDSDPGRGSVAPAQLWGAERAGTWDGGGEPVVGAGGRWCSWGAVRWQSAAVGLRLGRHMASALVMRPWLLLPLHRGRDSVWTVTLYQIV